MVIAPVSSSRFIAFCMAVLLTCAARAKDAPIITVTINPDASPAIEETAREFAALLGAASGREFSVSRGEFTKQGIYLGVRKNDESESVPRELASLGPEGVSIEADGKSITIVGNTELAARNGVYIYLERLGYRWFFPHEAWHVVPKVKTVFTEFLTVTAPDYESRRIWYAYGTASKKCSSDYRNWNKYNCLDGAFRVSCGHSYDGIIHRNEAEFKEHPEYFALSADGKRKENKFCVTSKGLIDLCIRDRFREIERSKKSGDPTKEAMMVSMDPSDGPGTCECSRCREIGTVSDRIFHLANEVAKAVGKKYPGKWVGLYAYSSHQMPTDIKLEPNVYVQVATAFNRTPYSTEELIEMWGKRVTKLGIREYYGVMAWDWDMPGKPRGAKVAYVRKALPRMHAQNANAINAESNCGWISRGLGHYVAAKLMWDVNADVDALVADFYEKCFGKARGPIEKLFTLWQTYPGGMPNEHDLSIWLKLVRDADHAAKDEATKARIDQIKAYMHYVALYFDHKTGRDDRQFISKRQRAAKEKKKEDELGLEEFLADDGDKTLDDVSNLPDPEDPDNKYRTYLNLLSYAWRVKDLGICASYPLARRIANSAAPLPEYKFNHPECVWHDTRPVSRKEIDEMFQEDLRRYREITGISTVGYSRKYAPLDVKSEKPWGNRLRGTHEFVVYIPDEGEPMISVAIGFIYAQVWDHSVKFYELGHDIDDANDEPILQQAVRGDREYHQLNIGELEPGKNYKMIISDRMSSMKIKTDGGVKLSLLASPTRKIRSVGRSNYCFYVPEGTSKFVIVATGPMNVQRPNGQKQEFQTNAPKMLEFDVKKGEHGVWKILYHSGTFYFMGLPPVAALSPQDLLVPEPMK